jgi:UDP-glucose 4-epimerase
MEKQKVVVTGGAGFIGSNLVDELIKEGFDVHVIDNMIAGKEVNVNSKATLHKVDIRNLEDIKPIIKGAKYVFHLAALPQVQYSIEHPVETSDVNIMGTLNVLIASKEGGVEKVIYSASCSAYGDQEKMPLVEDMKESPKSPYAMQKFVGEVICRQWSDTYGLPTACLRYFNVYGPRLDPDGPYSLVIGVFLKLKNSGKPLTITGDGTQTRDFTHVRDIVSANILAAKSDKIKKGESINIGTGKNHSINDLAKLISDNIEYVPARHEPRDALADNSLAKEMIGWEPKVGLEEGVGELMKEFGLR